MRRLLRHRLWSHREGKSDGARRAEIEMAKKNETTTSLERIEGTLGQVIAMLSELVASSRRPNIIKTAYSPAEVATILGKRPYTVREWCRLQRINATKRPYGRGSEQEWEISHEEVKRIRNHGLLPVPKCY